MKSHFAPALLCLALFSFCADAAPKTSDAPVAADPVQVEVRTPKPQYLGGEPVIVTVTLRNNTPNPVWFLVRPADFEFALKNDRNRKGRGIKVVATARGRDENESGIVGEQIVAPNSSLVYKVVLSRLFDMSRVGTYTISGHKNLKLENPAPGGSLIGAPKVARDVKIVVLEADVSSAP